MRLDELERALEVEQGGAAGIEGAAGQAGIDVRVAGRREAHRPLEVPGGLGGLVDERMGERVMDRLAIGRQPERLDRLGVGLVDDGDP